MGEGEQDGRIKIRTPTANDSDDEHALLGIEGGLLGVTNATKIVAIRQFASPLSLTPLKSNIGLPQSTDPLQPLQSHASSII